MLIRFIGSLFASTVLIVLLYYFYDEFGWRVVAVGEAIGIVLVMFLNILFTRGDDFFALPNWIGFVINCAVFTVGFFALGYAWNQIRSLLNKDASVREN